MELIKQAVAEGIEPRALAAGYHRVQRTLWQRRTDELRTAITLEMSKGMATERNFSIDWAIYVPGLLSLVYGRDEPAAEEATWPAVLGGSENADPALSNDWLKAQLPMSDEYRAALVGQIGRHGDAVIRFLGKFDTRRDVRVFLLESSGQDWLRMHQPVTPTRKFEVAAGLALLDHDKDDALRLIDDLEQALAGTPWNNTEGRQPLERLRAATHTARSPERQPLA